MPTDEQRQYFRSEVKWALLGMKWTSGIGLFIGGRVVAVEFLPMAKHSGQVAFRIVPGISLPSERWHEAADLSGWLIGIKASDGREHVLKADKRGWAWFQPSSMSVELHVESVAWEGDHEAASPQEARPVSRESASPSPGEGQGAP